MFRKFMAVILTCMVISGLTGCAQEVDSSPRPIDPSVDICSSCNMSIVNMHFAAEMIDPKGQVQKFDDIGCLTLYLKKQSIEMKGLTIYVKDFNTMNWIPAQSANYVKGKIDTPMNFGIVGFESKEAAQNFARRLEGATSMNWEEILTVKQTVSF